MVSKSGYSGFFSRADSKYTKGLSKSTHFFAKGKNKYRDRSIDKQFM